MDITEPLLPSSISRGACFVYQCKSSVAALRFWNKKKCTEHRVKHSKCSCNPPYGFYPFPSEREERQIWLRMINRKDMSLAAERESKEPLLLRPARHEYVCSLHFKKGCSYPVRRLGYPPKTTIERLFFLDPDKGTGIGEKGPWSEGGGLRLRKNVGSISELISATTSEPDVSKTCDHDDSVWKSILTGEVRIQPAQPDDASATEPASKLVNTRKQVVAPKRPLPLYTRNTRKTRKLEPGKNVLLLPQKKRVCGLDCPGVYGLRPRLVCNVCLCLFHPECVYIDNAVESFVCDGCMHKKRQAMVNAPLCVSNFGEQTSTPETFSAAGNEPSARLATATVPMTTPAVPMTTAAASCRRKQYALTYPASTPDMTSSPPNMSKPTITMQTMLHVYQCFNKIFEYLELPDLLRAAQVCKTWRSMVTNHPKLRLVTLDCSISDWETFGDFLFSRKTESLDLCSLELTGKFDKEWEQFQSIVPRLRYLRNISLGQCPPSVLYSVVEELPFLETLQAEYITETDREPDVWCTNATIDLSRLSSFRCLRELRLRGMAGLNTQNSNYSRVQRLAQLKSLRKLSLTSLKQVDGFELSFLETLTLDELEIGDCDTWTDETYAYLNKMNLKKLHLENCGESDKHLSLALPNWQSLRELNLIMVAVNECLGPSLAKLTKLEILSICPCTRDDDSITNRNTLLAVRDLKHLKNLLWCGVVSPKTEQAGEKKQRESHEMVFLKQGIEESLYYRKSSGPPSVSSTDNENDVTMAPQTRGKNEVEQYFSDLMETLMNESDQNEPLEDESVQKEVREMDITVENEDQTGEGRRETVEMDANTSSPDKEEDTDTADETEVEVEMTDNVEVSLNNSSSIETSKVTDSNKESKIDESVVISDGSELASTAESAKDSTAETIEKPEMSRKQEDVTSSDTEPRRLAEKNDTSSVAFITIETLIEILQFHLPDTDIRVDPIGY